MDPLISRYKELTSLQRADFVLIDHEDAMVATVFKVTQPNGEELILKVCSRAGDYFRESYFLHHFSEKIPVPQVIQLVPPKDDLHGAILMKFLPGKLLNTGELTDELCYKIGSILGTIHLDRVKGYGDLTQPDHLNSDPRLHFTMKFEEGLEECINHLPASLLERCRKYYDKHVDLLIAADGPCVVHRDFRPGNIIAHNGKLEGIIDWSSARGGFAEEDFCPLEFGEWFTNSSYKNSFLAGYGNIRKIPHYQVMMPLLRLSRAIATIGFTVKRGSWKDKGARIYQSNRQHLESFLQDT